MNVLHKLYRRVDLAECIRAALDRAPKAYVESFQALSQATTVYGLVADQPDSE